MIDRMSIDRDSPVPPYQQVAAILRERIESGQITSRLPSIADLVGEFGIARFTAAKALRVLVDEGTAEVSPGMGTYVKKH
jgi:GntR family transcriptional regulator